LSISLALAATTSLFAFASEAVIGMTSSQNGVTLNDAKVSGNATLFDGSTVRTEGFSRFSLKNGTRLDLGAGASAQVFANRASLTAGMGEVQSPSGFELDTKELKIRTVGSNSIARVKIESDRVLVTALNAPVNVLNGQGLLVAKVTPGMPLSFMPQGAAAANAFNVTGCVVQKSGVAVLDDETGKQVFELRGLDFSRAVGNRVHVVGTIDATATAAAGASQVVKATSATVTRKGGCDKVAKAIGGTTTAAGLAGAGAAAGGAAAAAGGVAGAAAGTAGAAAGVAGAAAAGIGTTAAVVGGVAAATAGTLGGLAASGTIINTSPSSPE
jgi:hypothetical protein